MTWSDILLGTIGAIVLIAALLFSVALVWSAVLTNSEYKQEERHWLELRGNARRGEAEVLGLARPPGRLTKRGRHAADMAAAELRLAYRDDQGALQEATLKTFIDEELLYGFVRGSKVHVLYSNATPPVVAIDRDRTQVEIPSTTTA
ncbi:cbb3-type cytochrome oxidase subunit 3 [Variovorax sp. SG517]|uniref:hypothetical protein n=1 Tax=Variovorax sp. SG517 TaxID=2587117 RepID=UPI00159E413B|nr:hypothetical protein [Variovorax sp. SG517]NVM89625.1 cbb3-type cytochrome oxidase subunit 3 [Variovorax sp. SG517]